MPVRVYRSVEVPLAVAAGALTSAVLVEDRAVEIQGAFTATLSIQGSQDEVVWHNVVTGITAAGMYQVALPYYSVRINTTAYTNGTPLAFLVGSLPY